MIQNLPYAIGFSLLNLLFLPLNWYMNRKKIQSCVRTNFDDRLPFIPLFYFPYLAFFLMIIFGPYLFALYFPLVIYKPIIISLLIDMFLSMVIWSIFPCIVIKPKHIDHDEHSYFVRKLLSYGRNYGNCNSIPSAHISLITLYFIWLTVIFPSLWLLWVALSLINILSVLLTRQHYIWDVLTGVLLSFIIYWFVQGIVI